MIDETFLTDGFYPDAVTLVEVPVTDEDTADDPPTSYGQSPLYSFGPQHFGYLYLGSTDSLVISEDQRTLLMWVEKAVRTPRGRYLIYGDDYGTDMAAGVGGNGSYQELLLGGAEDLKRCLFVHPLIEEVTEVRFARAGGDGDSIHVYFTIVDKLGGETPVSFLIGEGVSAPVAFSPGIDPPPPVVPPALAGDISDVTVLTGDLTVTGTLGLNDFPDGSV